MTELPDTYYSNDCTPERGDIIFRDDGRQVEVCHTDWQRVYFKNDRGMQVWVKWQGRRFIRKGIHDHTKDYQ